MSEHLSLSVLLAKLEAGSSESEADMLSRHKLDLQMLRQTQAVKFNNFKDYVEGIYERAVEKVHQNKNVDVTPFDQEQVNTLAILQFQHRKEKDIMNFKQQQDKEYLDLISTQRLQLRDLTR